MQFMSTCNNRQHSRACQAALARTIHSAEIPNVWLWLWAVQLGGFAAFAEDEGYI